MLSYLCRWSNRLTRLPVDERGTIGSDPNLGSQWLAWTILVQTAQ